LAHSELQSEAYRINLEEEQRLTDRLKHDIDILKSEHKEYTIDIPTNTVEQLKKKLISGDKYTLETIIEYLKLDNFELIKNVAKIIDKDNAY